MDAREYKNISLKPNVLSRKIIEDTIEILRESNVLPQLLKKITDVPPIEKPPQHRGADDDDLFYVELSADEIKLIVNGLTMVEASVVTEPLVAASKISEITKLVDVWNRVAF